MKFKYLISALVSVLLSCASLVANAGLIYDFDVSDVSWASSVTGDFSDITYFVEFEDTTDLNFVLSTNIIQFGFTEAGVTHIADHIATLNVQLLFDDIGGTIYLKVGQVFAQAHLYDSTGPVDMQLGASGSTSLVAGSNFAHSSTNPAYYVGVLRVPEPSTIAIFSLGIIGLASRQFKKQS